MTVRDALVWGVKQLKKTDPASPRLPTSLFELRGASRGAGSASIDASVLLCAALGKPKEFLYTYPEKKLTPVQITKYKKFISRRAKREPVAYILGKKEFYGFEFLVSPAVLIPRPDTETLISAVLSTIGSEAPYSYPHHSALELSRVARCKQIIIDVGTGSGAIAITLKKLLPASTRSNRGEPQARVFASDISPTALALARKNARRLGAKITFKKGNLLSPFRALLDLRCPIVITANLPYLSRAEWQKTAPEVKKYEPYGALVGGKHGWEIYEKLFKELAKIIHSPSTPLRSARDTKIIIFVEIGYDQKPAIIHLAKKILHPRKIEFFKDLAGKWRVAKIVVGSK